VTGYQSHKAGQILPGWTLVLASEAFFLTTVSPVLALIRPSTFLATILPVIRACEYTYLSEEEKQCVKITVTDFIGCTYY
jgi:hypothetical protein